MRRCLPVNLFLLGVLCVPAFAWEMAPQAAAKVDPRLLLLYRHPGRLEYHLGKTITIQGPSVDRIVVPLLVKTRGTDQELARCGAEVGSRFGDIATVTIPLERLEELASMPQVEAVEASYRLHDALDVSVPECGGSDVHNGSPPYYGSDVIVGLLDSGIDPYHADFTDAAGTSRVFCIWDQYGSGPPPSGYSYGTEWTTAQIVAGQCTMADPGSHGSHCAGIAAGDGSSSAHGYIGMAPRANIIMVANISDDLFTYGWAPPWSQTPYAYGAMDGLAYMQSKAQAAGMPLVVNWSQAVAMGPHDGSTLLEQAVDNFIAAYDVPVVIAAGNEGSSNLHASGTVTTGSPMTASFSTGSVGDPLNGDVAFEMWYNSGDRMGVEIAPPAYGFDARFGPDETWWPFYVASNGDTVAVYSNSSHPVSHKGYFLVYLLNYNIGVAQGTWQIRVSADNDLPQGGAVDLWLERNRHVWWKDHLDQQTTVAVPGSCTEGICVAAYNTKLLWEAYDGGTYSITGETLWDIAGFSSRGPRADGYPKPDIAAPGQIVASVLSTGASAAYTQQQPFFVTPDGLHLLFAGTSMACPHVAGTVALMLEKDPNLSHTQVKQYLIDTARSDQYTGPGWNTRSGWGKLDAKAAVDAVAAAVELANFTAAPLQGAVRLEWEVVAASSHAGFNVHRSEKSERRGMSLLNTSLIHETRYLDETALPGRIYYYWLEDVDLSGVGSLHGPVEVTTLGDAATVWLAAPRPNPTPGPVTIRCCLPKEGEVSVALYDLGGRRVASVVDGDRMGTGWHETRWEPSGATLPAGRYLCRLVFEGTEASRPIVVVK